MEINLKINFPENSTTTNPSQMPKALKISYSFDFHDGAVKSNTNDIKLDENDLRKNIILNIKGNDTPKIENSNEIPVPKIIIKPKEENKVEINKESKGNDENNVNNEERRESSDNQNKLDKNYKNTRSGDSRGHSTNSNTNMYSKRGFQNRISNNFRGRTRGCTRGFQKEKLHFNPKPSDVSPNKIVLPKDAVEDLFVTGIKDDMTEEDLKNAFSPFGEVVQIKILKEKSTQKVKGVAFVKYKEKKSAFLAVMNAEKIVCKGKFFKIKYNNKVKEYTDKNNNNENEQILPENKDENEGHSHNIRERSRDKEKDKEEGEID